MCSGAARASSANNCRSCFLFSTQVSYSFSGGYPLLRAKVIEYRGCKREAQIKMDYQYGRVRKFTTYGKHSKRFAKPTNREQPIEISDSDKENEVVHTKLIPPRLDRQPSETGSILQSRSINNLPSNSSIETSSSKSSTSSSDVPRINLTRKAKVTNYIKAIESDSEDDIPETDHSDEDFVLTDDNSEIDASVVITRVSRPATNRIPKPFTTPLNATKSIKSKKSQALLNQKLSKPSPISARKVNSIKRPSIPKRSSHSKPSLYATPSKPSTSQLLPLKPLRPEPSIATRTRSKSSSYSLPSSSADLSNIELTQIISPLLETCQQKVVMEFQYFIETSNILLDDGFSCEDYNSTPSWQKLGEATYSEVYTFTSSPTSKPIVIKIIPIFPPKGRLNHSVEDSKHFPQESDWKEVWRELRITELLSNQTGFVRLIGSVPLSVLLEIKKLTK